jgi:hypothetical protein
VVLSFSIKCFSFWLVCIFCNLNFVFSFPSILMHFHPFSSIFIHFHSFSHFNILER